MIDSKLKERREFDVSSFRCDYERDRARIIHSATFRRLQEKRKCWVFLKAIFTVPV